MTPRGFHYSAGPADCAQARGYAAPNGLTGHCACGTRAAEQVARGGVAGCRVFCLSVWGCLLCWLLSFVFRCLPAPCCRGPGCSRLGLLLLGSCCGVVLLWPGGVAVAGRPVRLWCRRRVFLPAAFAGGLRLVGLSVAVSGCRWPVLAVGALVAGVGAVLCLSGLAVGALCVEAGVAGGGGFGCRRRFCKKFCG